MAASAAKAASVAGHSPFPAGATTPPAAPPPPSPKPPSKRAKAKGPSQVQREACETCGLLLHSLRNERARALADGAAGAAGVGGAAARGELKRKKGQQQGKQAAKRREAEERLRVEERLEARDVGGRGAE